MQTEDLRRVIASKNTQDNTSQSKSSLSSRFGEISKVRKNTLYKGSGSRSRGRGRGRGASRGSRGSNRMIIDEPSTSRPISKMGRGRRGRGRGRRVPMSAEKLDKDLDQFMMKDPQVAKTRLDKDLEGYMMDVESTQVTDSKIKPTKAK